MFDHTSPEAIINFAQRLRGRTLREICADEIENHDIRGKGNFGQILEKFYFGYEPNSNAEPDFKEAELELKSTPLKVLQSGAYRSKERLVLNIIDYLKVHNEEFEESSFWKKNAHLLLVFYLHRAEDDLLDYIISLVDEWKYPGQDLEVIKKDWETIKEKIKAGKAHELSEGDTFYLGACTKGGKGGNMRDQPFNDLKAKQRAYSLKQSYVNHIIASIAREEEGEYGKLIPSLEVSRVKTIQELVQEKFAPLYGETDEELIEKFGLHEMNRKTKQFHANLIKAVTNAVFEVPEGRKIENYIEEFDKADLGVRTVRLDQNNLPCEDVSLPSFEYSEIYNGNWRESRLKEYVERKYLFIFFKFDEEGRLRLDKVKFWNMPNEDIHEAHRIWVGLKKVITYGNIVRKVSLNKSGDTIRYTNFPSIKTKNIHVRPHGQTSEDTYSLPVQDKITGAMEYTKHSFWFNKKYVRDTIYL